MYRILSRSCFFLIACLATSSVDWCFNTDHVVTFIRCCIPYPSTEEHLSSFSPGSFGRCHGSAEKLTFLLLLRDSHGNFHSTVWPKLPTNAACWIYKLQVVRFCFVGFMGLQICSPLLNNLMNLNGCVFWVDFGSKESTSKAMWAFQLAYEPTWIYLKTVAHRIHGAGIFTCI